MDFRDAWLSMPRVKRERLAEKLGTSYKYLQKLSGGFAVPSLEFALALKRELPKLDLNSFSRDRIGIKARGPSP